MYSYNIVQSDPGNHFAHHLQIEHITIKCVKIPINIALHSLENTWHLFRWNILFTVIPAQSFENPACSMKLKTFQRDYLHTLHLMAPFFNYYYCALHEYLHRHNVHMPFNKFALVGLTWTPFQQFFHLNVLSVCTGSTSAPYSAFLRFYWKQLTLFTLEWPSVLLSNHFHEDSRPDLGLSNQIVSLAHYWLALL